MLMRPSPHVADVTINYPAQQRRGHLPYSVLTQGNPLRLIHSFTHSQSIGFGSSVVFSLSFLIYKMEILAPNMLDFYEVNVWRGTVHSSTK